MSQSRAVSHGCFDSFSGLAADLPKGKRTKENVLSALRLNPRISTWDMSEHPWLCGCIADLKRENLIVEDKDEPYPWHRFAVQNKEPTHGN